jgi:lipopolysaccharide/colanic/teichoic acid biosynthesis glycosyltransferase
MNDTALQCSRVIVSNRWYFRVLDMLLAGVGLVALSPIIILVWLLASCDTRSPLFVQERVGRYEQTFLLFKFRTMRLGTPSVASHLAETKYITRLGQILRRTKLDELPQLWNVFVGDMSLVGPRPGLTTQIELIEARQGNDVFFVRPGITGLAQIRGIDMSTPKILAEADAKMIATMSIRNYLRYILHTVFGKGRGDAIRR